jgi:hypothetical protein
VILRIKPKGKGPDGTKAKNKTAPKGIRAKGRYKGLRVESPIPHALLRPLGGLKAVKGRDVGLPLA